MACSSPRCRLARARQTVIGANTETAFGFCAAARQRASDAGHAGSARVHGRLVGQAEAARTFARLADLAAGLVGKLFEADRRR
jgi:hypothetical protein